MLFLLSLINEIVPLIVGHKLDSVKEDITGLQLSGGGKKKKKSKWVEHTMGIDQLPSGLPYYSTSEQMIIPQKWLILWSTRQIHSGSFHQGEFIATEPWIETEEGFGTQPPELALRCLFITSKMGSLQCISWSITRCRASWNDLHYTASTAMDKWYDMVVQYAFFLIPV